MVTGPDTRSIGGLLRDLGSDLGDLIRQELLLVRTEITTKVQRSVTALVTMLAGGLLAFVALILLLGAVVDGLASAGLERWVAELIVGGSVTLVGFILVRVGQKALAASSLTPERTASSVRRDINLLKEHVA
jgi:Putative Actinobacterial Holin-X, holin superfamily III